MVQERFVRLVLDKWLDSWHKVILTKAISTSVLTLTILAAEPTSTSLSREVRIERTQKPKDLSLDELFRKTAALPHLYYLPNTDEEAKAKLARLQNI
jgi:hypothetical protein